MADSTKVAQKRAAVLKAYQNIFNSPDGQTVLADLMNAHGMLSSSFSGDPLKTVFKEGERNVVLRILTILKTDETQLKQRIDAYAREQME